MPDAIRPTKKQKELLAFIAEFISEHGYSPSYREIKDGLKYNSIATVALHINSLITRGHLIKRGRSARSLELIKNVEEKPLQTNSISASEEKWLVQKVEYFFSQAESANPLTQVKLDQLYVLIGALKVLGIEGAAQSYIARLSELKGKVKAD